MKAETKERLALFAENTQNIRKGFAWQNPLTKRLAALLYAQENKPVDHEAIRQCHSLIKENTGIFSMFRGNMALCVAALLSLSERPQELFENTIAVYEMLKKAKFHASDYLAVAAYQIAAGANGAHYPRVVERSRAFYDAMKAEHWFYTGQDDYIFSAMLGLSDLNVETGAERMEYLHSSLKDDFWDKNSVQTLAQILVLGGESDAAVNRVLALRDALKAQKLRLDKTYTLPALGVLALLPVDIGVMVDDLGAARDFLRTQKGFSAFTVTTQELLLYTAAVIATEYANEIKDGILAAALSTSITNIIIAQQTAMIVAVNASTAAASSSN